MAGPVDTRVNPTKVNELAHSKPLSWFEQNVITTVPLRYPGALRRVYPGFLQVAGFVSMNLERHIRQHVSLYNHLVRGEEAEAEVIAVSQPGGDLGFLEANLGWEPPAPAPSSALWTDERSDIVSRIKWR